MKVELKTKYHTEYVSDTVTFEDDGDYIEIVYNGSRLVLRKSELQKVLTVLSED